MFVHKPMKHKGRWCVLITEDKSPLSEIVERIPDMSREEAWVEYRRMLVETKVSP